MEHPYSIPNIKMTKHDYCEIETALESGWVSIGQRVDLLSDLCKERYGVKHALPCCNATQGLTIAIKAAGWSEKPIKLPSFTWPSTAYSAQCCSSPIVYGDIDTKTWIMKASSGFNNIVVDTFGSEAQTEYPEKTIFDAAHGWDNPNLGNRGLAEVVSFSFTKNVTGCEGGIILTNNNELARTARELIRLSARMSELHAAVTISSIASWDNELKDSRAELITAYNKGISKTHTKQQIDIATNHSVYGMLFDTPQETMKIAMSLATAGFETKRYYEPIINTKDLNSTRYVYDRILCLPVHRKAHIHQDEIIDIINHPKTKTPGKEFLTRRPSEDNSNTTVL
jgi:dTDP-4-amino-4,6-dideoxygalactose transaminase